MPAPSTATRRGAEWTSAEIVADVPPPRATRGVGPPAGCGCPRPPPHAGDPAAGSSRRRRFPSPATLRGDGQHASDQSPLLQRHPALGRPARRQRPGRDPQLRCAAGSVRVDLLHRRLPRPHDASTTPTACAARPARWRRRSWPWAWTRRKCTLFVQSHRPEVTELMWLFATVTPVELAAAHTDLQGEARQPARRRQPRAAHLPRPAGRRHRPLQGVGGAGGQGPGGPPGAVAGDRPGLQQPLRRDLPGAAGRLHRGPGRPGHRRREEDVEVDREHDRDLRPRGRDPAPGHGDGHRHAADQANRSRPPGALQRLPAPPLLRRRLRRDLGGRAHRADRLRRHEEAPRGAPARATTPTPASATSS